MTKALSDANRTRAVMALADGELCVCQLIELLQLAPSTVSKHLSVLCQAGLVQARKEGRWMYYRLPGATGPTGSGGALDWMRAQLAKDPTVREDARKLKRIRSIPREDLCHHYSAERNVS
jgi:ArsR family transcriptional regulator, arsenate/arsenite/antimonite-responsive transcriptional repressor